MKDRYMKFEFDENQLISYLSKFISWYSGTPPNEEDRGNIASWVMERIDDKYEFPEVKNEK